MHFSGSLAEASVEGLASGTLHRSYSTRRLISATQYLALLLLDLLATRSACPEVLRVWTHDRLCACGSGRSFCDARVAALCLAVCG